MNFYNQKRVEYRFIFYEKYPESLYLIGIFEWFDIYLNFAIYGNIGQDENDSPQFKVQYRNKKLH